MKVLPQQAQKVTDIFTPQGVDSIYNYLNGKGDSPVTSREISISQIQNAIIFLLSKNSIVAGNLLHLSESIQMPPPRIEYGIRAITSKMVKEAMGIDGEEESLEELGEGDTVMISGNSSYVRETDKIGILTGNFAGKYMEEVIFEGGYQSIFSRRDLVSTTELDALKHIDRDAFTEELINCIMQDPRLDISRLLRTFEVGDEIVINEAGGKEYSITTKGSKGTVVKVSKKSIKVKFSYIQDDNPNNSEVGRIYEIEKEHANRTTRINEDEAKDTLRLVIQTTLDRIQFDSLNTETKDKIIENSTNKLIEGGFVIPLDESDKYALNFSEISKFVAPQLESIYTNPKLFSTSVMFEPPAERLPNVLRLQLTDGCDYNKCTFCGGFNGIHHSQKTPQEFIKHTDKVVKALGTYKHEINRLFLGSGNGLDIEQSQLEVALEHIQKKFKDQLKRVAVYGTTKSILKKTDNELRRLRYKNLKCIYWGVESGSDEVLKYVRKGSTQEDMIQAAHKVNDAGIDLSAMIMPGLGGKRLAKEHANSTIELINQIECKYITLMSVNPGEKSIYQRIMNQEIEKGENRPLTDVEIVQQVRYIIQGLDLNSSMKIGMYGEEIDAVGKNPISFNAEFSGTGKQAILAICDEYLETHKDIEHPEDVLIEEKKYVIPEITTVEKEIEENISESSEVSTITSLEEIQEPEEVTVMISKDTIGAKFKKFIKDFILFH